MCHYCSTAKRTAASICVGSCSRIARAGRYSGGNKYCITERNRVTSHRHEKIPPLIKRPRPTHSTTHRPTRPPSHHKPQPPCATAVQQYVQQQTDAFGPIRFYIEISVGCGEIDERCGERSEDCPVRCRCVVWYIKTFFWTTFPPFWYFRFIILMLA